MGSKKHKKESRKRKHHRSDSKSPDRDEVVKHKKHKKHKHHHHKERKKEKLDKLVKLKTESSSGSDDDVIYVPPPPVISKQEKMSPPPAPTIGVPAPKVPPAPKIGGVPLPKPPPPAPKIGSVPLPKPPPPAPKIGGVPLPKPPPPAPKIGSVPLPKLAPPAPKIGGVPLPKAVPPPPKIGVPLPKAVPPPPKIGVPLPRVASPTPQIPPPPPKIGAPPPPKITKRSPSPSPTPPPPHISHSPPPAPRIKTPPPPANGKSEECLSIDDTNALRAKLGLKPLTVTPKAPAAPSGAERAASIAARLTTEGPVLAAAAAEAALKSREPTLDIKICPETNQQFVHKPAEDLTQKKLSEKLRNKIAERKERRQYEKKLASMKSLGAESDDEDTANWISKSRKLEKERLKAQLKAKELDEMDEVFGIGDLVQEEIKKDKVTAYSASHLRGLKVEHDMDTFSEGRSIILTLKDKGVLEDEEDALVNVNMVDDERYKKNVLNKKTLGKPFGYNAVDSGEMDVDTQVGVLSKYDEEIQGVKKSSFKLGETSSERTKAKLQSFLHEDRKVSLESLALPELKLASDYYAPEEMKIKKPRKKKKIRSRTLKADDLLGDAPREQSLGSRGIVESDRLKVESEDPMDIDGTPLVPVLGSDGVKVEEESDTELELALKKARRLKKMPEEKPKFLPKIEEFFDQVKEEPEDDGGMSSIILNSTAEFCRTLGDIPTYGMAGNRDEEPEIIDFDKPSEAKKKRQEELDDRGGWNDVEMDEKLVETKQIEGTILDAEPDLGAGVAGALRLAVSKGYLEKETNARPSASRFSHLTAQNYSIDDKAHAADDEKAGRQHRYLGPTMDFKDKDGYKPNIKLEYIDDDGHLLSAKEAFRYLSHKFHGKGPGKNKVEKRMKQNEQEALMKQMSSSDTPLGTLQMLQHKQKETQQPFVVLSGSKALTTPASISKTKMSK